MKKVLRQTGYVATLGISYLIRQNKKKKKSFVHSLTTGNRMTSNDIIENLDSIGLREAKIGQTSRTDDAISCEPLSSYVSKEWHEKTMQDYVQLVNDEHNHFLKLVQQEIRIAETSREMAESNNLQLRSENLMLKNDILTLLKNTNFDNVAGPREEKIDQTSQTDDAISCEPLTSYVSKEWHEKTMQDFVRLSTDEHHHFLQLVQQEIRVAETSREMAESNNSHLRSEIFMPKNEISVLNDIHETEMAERNSTISDLYNEIATLRIDLAAASIDASPIKKPRHVHSSYKQPAKTSFMTKVSNFMEETQPPENTIVRADLAAEEHASNNTPIHVYLSYKRPAKTSFRKFKSECSKAMRQTKKTLWTNGN
jgi:hypothetical protein